jgi:hypothetical protein
MPRRKPAMHTYSVYILTYASNVDRSEPITHPEQLGGQLVYMGTSERLAAWHFYQAVRTATADPLAFVVLMYKDRQVIARARIEHSL